MKINKKLKKPGIFRKGTYFELLENLGPIPKGVYRMARCDYESADFFPGSKVAFSIIGNWRDKVKLVPFSLGWKIRTSQDEFLRRYYELLNQSSRYPMPGAISDTATMCFVDPSVCQEVH